MAFRMLATVSTIPVLMMTTTMTDLAAVLVEKLKIPFKYAFMFITALRFIPTFSAEMDQIMQAQMSRVRAEEAVTRFQSEYPIKLMKFDYRYKDDKPFNINAIYHDDKFTYIKTEASEKFAVYETKDAKPNLVNFELQDGTYILSKVVDKGYLEKRSSRANPSSFSVCPSFALSSDRRSTDSDSS
jgi:hypothetical protein